MRGCSSGGRRWWIGLGLALVCGCSRETSTLDDDAGPMIDGALDSGTPNSCATAVARGRIQGSGSDWMQDLSARPLSTLELDGSPSAGPMGEAVAAYSWRVVTRPMGSAASLEPSDGVAMPRLFLDLSGEYLVSLGVVDAEGRQACESSEVRVSVGPNPGLSIQLVWDTPGDPDATDTGVGRGTDLDLHLKHPQGTWNTPPYDCFSENAGPSWGLPAFPGDDPQLDRDDIDGWGPENIRLDEPEGTAGAPNTYDVGVYVVDDHGFGPSTATVRIFIGDAEELTVTSPELEPGNFWHAAQIAWPSREVQAVDVLHPNGFP